MAVKSWIYESWICTGNLQEDGSMIDANVTDNHGKTRDRNRSFNSIDDFKKYVDKNN